jgi:octaprenyl-diphosphate synthase
VDLKIYSENDFPKYLPKLNSLFDELFSGGKGFRAKLTQSVADSLNIPTSTTHLLCQTIEFIHNSSLLHDDLIDRSSLRRGKTAAWLKYTPEYAVLAGDYLLARVMVNLSDFGNIQLIRLTSQAISDLLEGEWLQDALVKRIEVSAEEMDRVHLLKTGSLFKWCLRAPFFAAEEYSPSLHSLLERLGSILGLLLQRSDDLLDFNVRNNERKNVMGDLKAGYINSFTAFLFADLDEATCLKASQTFDLEAFKQTVGQSYFVEKLKAFDSINEALINEYKTLLISLEDHLRGEWQPVIETLQALPEPLYWRNV